MIKRVLPWPQDTLNHHAVHSRSVIDGVRLVDMPTKIRTDVTLIAAHERLLRQSIQCCKETIPVDMRLLSAELRRRVFGKHDQISFRPMQQPDFSHSLRRVPRRPIPHWPIVC